LFDASSTTKLFYIRWDDVRVRKYVDPEPQHGSWGTEEGEPPNTAPTIEEFQAPSTAYANKYFLLNATIVDGDGASDFDNATVELSNSIVLKWDNATDTFTVQSDPNGYCTLDASGSFKSFLNSTAYRLSWKIKLSWSYPEGPIDVVASNTKVFDSSGASGTGSQTSLLTLEDDLIIHTDANVDKERANPSDTLTFTGTIYYEGTSTVPEDVSGITVKVELNGIDKGLDNSPTGGTYSVTVTAENLVASYNYTVYAVTDENSVQNQTLPVTVDALEVDDYTVDLANEKVYAHMRYASDHADIDGGTVAFAGRTAVTNSTGWACFDLASGSDFSWNQTAYGTTDGTYGITACQQNQTLLIARKTRLIQSELEISSLSWDGTKLTVQFAGTTGTYTLKVSGPRPTYIKGTSYDLSTDYTTHLSLPHDGSRDIAVSYSNWGDFHIQGLSRGWIDSIYWSGQKLTLAISGTQNTTGTLTVYCGSRGSPQKTSGFSATPEYNTDTKILTGQYTFQSQVTITMDFTKETGSGTSGTGGTTPAITFTVGTVPFKVEQGKTIDALLNFTWAGVNQITVTGVRFKSATAEWIALAESLPKTVAKQIGATEGKGSIEVRVIVPADAQPGEYTVPATVEAEAVGGRVTAGGYITFTIVKPAPPLPSQVPDYMTYLFAALLLTLVAYAYLKR